MHARENKSATHDSPKWSDPNPNPTAQMETLLADCLELITQARILAAKVVYDEMLEKVEGLADDGANGADAATPSGVRCDVSKIRRRTAQSGDGIESKT